MNTNKLTRADLIEMALQAGTNCGEVFEVHAGPDGEHTVIGVKDTATFVCEWQAELGDVQPLKCRAYLGLVHVDGAHMVEI